jgi:hypothetical protein
VASGLSSPALFLLFWGSYGHTWVAQVSTDMMLCMDLCSVCMFVAGLQASLCFLKTQRLGLKMPGTVACLAVAAAQGQQQPLSQCGLSTPSYVWHRPVCSGGCVWG